MDGKMLNSFFAPLASVAVVLIGGIAWLTNLNATTNQVSQDVAVIQANFKAAADEQRRIHRAQDANIGQVKETVAAINAKLDILLARERDANGRN